MIWVSTRFEARLRGLSWSKCPTIPIVDDKPNIRKLECSGAEKETSNQKGRSYDPRARVTRWLLVFVKLPDLRIEINTVSTRDYE